MDTINDKYKQIHFLQNVFSNTQTRKSWKRNQKKALF